MLLTLILSPLFGTGREQVHGRYQYSRVGEAVCDPSHDKVHQGTKTHAITLPAVAVWLKSECFTSLFDPSGWGIYD
jgi:hypothetical protein